MKLEDIVNEAAAMRYAPGEEPSSWGTLLDLAALAAQEPQPPKFIMPGVPVGAVTGLFGHGGAGKSVIALHMATCIALGSDFFGLPTEQRRVLFLACEDRTRILHWRLDHICGLLRVDLRDLVRKLEVLDLVGANAILYLPTRNGAGFGVALGALESRIADLGAEVLFVDGSTHTFAGSEIDRAHVTSYVNTLSGLVDAERGAVVLVGHVDKVTAKGAGETSEGYSGSTAWNNAMRSRMYLYPETEAGDGDGHRRRTGRLFLETQKGNYGGTGTRTVLEWDAIANTFTGKVDAPIPSGMVDALRERAERKAILATFLACARATPPLIVPAAMQGPRTTHHVLSARPEFPDSMRAGSGAKRRFWRVIEEMRQLHYIEEREYRRTNRHGGSEFVLTPEGMRQCAQY